MRRWLPGIGRRASEVSTRELPDGQLRVTWQTISLLLGYPSVKLFRNLMRLRDTAGRLLTPAGGPLIGIIDRLEKQGLRASRRAYIETSDHTRRCALHLTCYACGGSRKRGVAPVRFRQTYHCTEMEVSNGELPDHLSVVLGFGTLDGLDIVWDLVNQHYTGAELLAVALEYWGSPRHGTLVALHAILPTIDGEQAETVAKLLRDDPETEDVGLEPYDTNSFLSPHPDEDVELLGI